MNVRWRGIALKLLPYVACAVPLVLYQALYARGYYPITEGWFSEYGHLIRSGWVPYRDFALLVPPLYPLQIAAFQSIFGESFNALRILGIFVTCGIAFALLDLLRNLFNPWVCAFAAAVATVYYQSGVAFFGYDFTQFLTLYVLIGAALLARSLRESSGTSDTRNELWLSAISGVFLGLSFLIKQSNGGVAAFALVIAGSIVAFVRYPPRLALLRVAAISAGICSPVVASLLWLISQHAASAFFDQVFKGAAGAKGGLRVALFAWVWYYFHDPNFWQLVRDAVWKLFELVAITSASAAVLEGLAFIRRPLPAGSPAIIDTLRRIVGLRLRVGAVPWLIPTVGLAALCVLVLEIAHGSCAFCGALRSVGASVFQSAYIWSVNFYIVAAVATLLLVSFEKTSGAARLFIIAALGVGLTFGNGTSGGLSEISTFLALAILFGYLIQAWLRYQLPALLPAVVALSFCSFFIEHKFAAPYAWWQVTVSPIGDSVCADATGIFKGICVPQNDYSSITTIQKLIMENSSSSEPIYVYPHMPVFYLLTDRQPFDGAVVSWFDFTSEALANDLSIRLRNEPPAVIVMAEIPQDVLTAHEHLFSGDKPLGQRKILASIASLRASGRIQPIARIKDLDGLSVDVFKRVETRPRAASSERTAGGSSTP